MTTASRRRCALGAAVVSLLATSAAHSAPPASKQRLDLAFVLLAKPAMPRGEDVVRAYPAYAAPGERASISASKSPAEPGAAQMLSLDVAPHGYAVIALFPAPVPNGEADDAVRLSISSLTKPWTLPAHRAHLIVTLSEPNDVPPREALARLTALVAAVTEASHAIGVYWGAAPATHAASFFMSTARRRGVAPMMLWIGVGAAREADGRTSLLSYGMKQLSLPDLLVVVPAAANGGSLATFFDLLAYVADRGKPLPEGDTIGRTDDERLPIHYVPSPIDPKTQIWRVELK